MSVNPTAAHGSEFPTASPSPGVPSTPSSVEAFVEAAVDDIDGVEYWGLSADLVPLVLVDGAVSRVRSDLEEARLETAPYPTHGIRRLAAVDATVFRVSNILPA